MRSHSAMSIPLMAVMASRPRLPGALWYISVQIASVSSGSRSTTHFSTKWVARSLTESSASIGLASPKPYNPG